MSPVHDEARTGYLNPNVDVREQGESAEKYISKEQYKVVFTIPGENILNLCQHSRIYLSAQVVKHDYKYLESVIPSTSMAPLLIFFMALVSFHRGCAELRAGGMYVQ